MFYLYSHNSSQDWEHVHHCGKSPVHISMSAALLSSQVLGGLPWCQLYTATGLGRSCCHCLSCSRDTLVSSVGILHKLSQGSSWEFCAAVFLMWFWDIKLRKYQQIIFIVLTECQALCPVLYCLFNFCSSEIQGDRYYYIYFKDAESEALEKLNSLSKFIKLVNGRVSIWTLHLDSRAYILSHHIVFLIRVCGPNRLFWAGQGT